jgi:hypothetical protein
MKAAGVRESHRDDKGKSPFLVVEPVLAGSPPFWQSSRIRAKQLLRKR